MWKKLKKLQKQWKFKFSFSKREKFALVVGILTLGLLGIQVSTPFWRFPLTGFLAFLTYILCAWGFREDINGVEWITLFILPIMFILATSLFYFLLPVRWLTRLPMAVLFALGMYAIMLVENIYNVAAVRTIQLLRAAYSVGLLLALVTIFMFLLTIVSLRPPAVGVFFLVFIVLFPITLQAFWAMELGEKISKRVIIYCFVSSFALAETSTILSFWPLQTNIEALFLTTVSYSLIGTVQQHLIGRLFHQTFWEFMAVSAIVFVLVLVTASWGG